MNKKFLEKYLPSSETVLKTRGLGAFRRWLAHPSLWRLGRNSVAGGVAVGLFAGTIPGPVQFILATILSVSLKVNLPVALTATLYSNPLTVVPIVFASYQIGRFVTRAENVGSYASFTWDGVSITQLVPAFFGWLQSLGYPYLIGTFILAVTLAAVGYALVMFFWRDEHLSNDAPGPK